MVVNNYPTKVGISVYAFFIGFIAGGIAWYADKMLLRWWLNDVEGYQEWLKGTSPTRLSISLLTAVWFVSVFAIRKKVEALEQQLRHMTDAASLHREAELFKLRQQLQPHFLYNSLNSISALIMIDRDRAQEMIGKLSDFLRHSVRREHRELIPVGEELKYIASYLGIEAARFGDRLKVIYENTLTEEAFIPPFLLQPILENAIKFGLYGRTGDVIIRVHIGLSNSMLIIRIVNPYDPSGNPPAGTGFGLEGIRRRMYLLYGRMDLIETESAGELFTTTLKIPVPHV
jgi:LytS/YehU family sensor histidine kinase